MVLVSGESATLAEPLTSQGTILGTLQYMAPEQLEGREADARTDIFAFGALLYEMTTGRRAFEAKTQASLIAKILETDVPAVSTRVPTFRPFLDDVVHGCLAKDPADRWQAAHDVKLQLQWLQRRGFRREVPPRRLRCDASRGGFRGSLPHWLSRHSSAASCGGQLPVVSTAGVLAQFEAMLPDDMDADPSLGDVVISPDGQRVVFSASVKGQTQLFLRDLASPEVVPVDDTENGFFPFWSPDSQTIAFFAGGKLKRMPVVRRTSHDTRRRNGMAPTAHWGRYVGEWDDSICARQRVCRPRARYRGPRHAA